MTFSKPHLLASVYLSPSGLGHHRYDLKYADDSTDPYFRIGRFYTGLASLQKIAWSSVRIHFETSDEWKPFKPIIAQDIRKLFPEAVVEDYRLERKSTWRKVTDNYGNNDLVYLHTNDDHAFVGRDTTEFEWLCHQMNMDNGLKMAAVTHFSEMTGILIRDQTYRHRFRREQVVLTRYAVGTLLCRSEFLASWWKNDALSDTDLIVRPDNPLGPSISFSPVQMLIPRREVMRHLDGYSHMNLLYPLAPLPNTHCFSPKQGMVKLKSEWTWGLWPASLFSLRGEGVHLHITHSSHSDLPWVRIRAAVAHLQAMWALRISFRHGYSMLTQQHFLPPLTLPIVFSLSLSNILILKNVIDRSLDFPLMVVLKALERWYPGLGVWRQEVAYKGLWRGIAMMKK